MNKFTPLRLKQNTKSRTTGPAKKPCGEVQRTFTTELTRSGHQTWRASRTPNTHEQSLLCGRPWPRHPRKDVDQRATHRDLTVSACHSPQSWRNALVCLFTPLDHKLINLPSSDPQPECHPERNAVELSANKAAIWNPCPSERETEKDRRLPCNGDQSKHPWPSLWNLPYCRNGIVDAYTFHRAQSRFWLQCAWIRLRVHIMCVVLRLMGLSKFQPRTWWTHASSL